MDWTYKSAGVDIDAGEETVRRIAKAVATTHTPAVLNDIGSFGALFDARFPGYEHPVLVSSIDGVGTKLKIAAALGIHDTVGRDLVNHCVNDILTCGARPLFFLDYFATGKLDPDIAEQVVLGLAAACRENGCALIGGETAEMPGLYEPGDYDLAGTIVGIVEQRDILHRDRVCEGDVLIGLPSTGLHTNGYSLARAVLLRHFTLTTRVEDLGCTLGEALLAVHRSYFPLVEPLLRAGAVNGISHITGGGIVGNTMRVIPRGYTLEIDWSAWDRPRLFRMIQELGNVPEADMRRTFNLGIGMILIVPPGRSEEVLEILRAESPVVMGTVRRETANMPGMNVP
ncbi:MAG: phosphoribosylformylglycinamidine cyclo-ligase [Bacteroidota bacterium]|nr:phosphoribosylformylglycinamidine cyclo-ligase [Bacteroidota bacterium]